MVREAAGVDTEQSAPAPEPLMVTSFYEWRAGETAPGGELRRRQIEHHLRREALFVERFIDDPSPRTLRAGAHLRLGIC